MCLFFTYVCANHASIVFGICMFIYIYIYIYIYIFIYTHTHTHTDRHRHRQRHRHRHRHRHNIHICKHTYTHMYLVEHLYVRTYLYSYAHTSIHSHMFEIIQMPRRPLSQTRTSTESHFSSCKRTYIHILARNHFRSNCTVP